MNRTWIAVTLLVFAAIVGAPFLVGGYHVFQLSMIVVYAVAVLGLNLLTGFSGQISLGHGAFFAVGAYVSIIAMTKFHVPYFLVPILGGAATYAFGYVFGRGVARLEGLYLALATFALAVSTPQVLKLETLDPWTGGSQGLVFAKPTSPIPALLDDDHWLYFFCVFYGVVLYVAAWNVIRGRTGRALVALRDHQIAAGAVGIDVASYKFRTFGFSAMYTGIAGSLGALVAGFISPESYTIFLSINILVGGVVGGITTIGGAIFGGAFIELAPDLASKISEDAPAALYGVILIGCMLAMPGGVAGLADAARRRIPVWRTKSKSA